MVFPVAICTERVEAKVQVTNPDEIANAGCNLHGACGGKDRMPLWKSTCAGCNLHGACGGKDALCPAHVAIHALQSARSVWRQRAG